MVPRWIAGLLACGTAVTAAAFPPIANHAALARTFALPALGQGAPPSRELDLALDLLNEFERLGFDANGNCGVSECLMVDGESYRLNLRYAARLSADWDWSVGLPLFAQSGGFLDRSIETWHGWFGLPNNGRERHRRNQYRFFYRHAGQDLLDRDAPQGGVGDLRLGLGRKLGALELRTELALPTGDEARLTGGAAGGAAWLEAPMRSAGGWLGYLAGGVSIASPGGALAQQQNRLVPFGGFGISAPVTQRLSLQSQMYFHGRLYDDTRLRNLYRFGAILGFGGRYASKSGWAVDLGLIEDLDVNVSPDFDLQMVLSWSAL